MFADPQIPDPVDPLAGFSILSLFSRTLRLPSAVHEPVAEYIDAIHSHFKATELRSPKKLLEQARTVVDSVTGSLGIKGGASTSLNMHEGRNEVAIEEGAENAHGRRPSMGRRRAQFSLLPIASEPVRNLTDSQKLDILEDPEEYFAEMDKLEKAEKEMQRQRGITMVELDQNAPPVIARRRRQSLLGKTATYKHRYSTGSINNENLNLQSWETSIPVEPNPSGGIMPPGTAHLGVSLQGPTDTAEDQVSKVCDELLSGNDEEMDKDKALILLQERLNIKPIVMNKICLPELHNARKSLPGYLGEALEMTRYEPSYQHDMLINHGTSIENIAGMERTIPRASPTLAKSPLASLPLLEGNLTKLEQLNDSRTDFDIDPLDARTLCQGQIEVHHMDSDNMIRSSEGVVHENGGTGVAREESQDFVAGSSTSSDMYVKAMPSVTCRSLNDNLVVGMDCKVDTNNDDSCGLHDEALGRIHEASTLAGQNHGSSNVKSSRGKRKGQLDGHFTKEADGKTETKAGLHGKRKRKDLVDGQSLNATDLIMEEPPSMHDSDQQQSSDKQKETAPLQKPAFNMKVGVAERDAASQPKRKRNELDGRKSLAVAGTKWVSGMRRSTRIRTRPLEYWKGERFIYGRIHNTMPTVIGLKYFSPAKNGGQPRVRVKSFVSEKYRSLVELAALRF